MDNFLLLKRHLAEWNVLLLIIGGLSLVALTIFFERVLYLRRSEIDTSRLLIQLKTSIQEHNIIEAIDTCEKTGGSVGQIVRAGLMKHDRDREYIESSMEIVGKSEIAKLEKNAKILSIIAHIAPLVGLLGTVLGFIQAFSEMRVSQLMDISATRIGEAMEYALITTAAGLVVAIPTIVAYNFLVSKIQAIILEMQITASEVVDLLTHET